jgi:hypothetical protein
MVGGKKQLKTQTFFGGNVPAVTGAAITSQSDNKRRARRQFTALGPSSGQGAAFQNDAGGAHGTRH